jgi:uncharacterized protein YlbG (UPF0298 family)
MNQLNTLVNYGKIHVRSKETDLKKRISLVFFLFQLKQWEELKKFVQNENEIIL